MPVFEDDPFGDIKPDQKPRGATPREVTEFHNRSDVDSSVNAQHHTLGIKHTTAAYGDHVHDGISSRKVGAGMNLSVTGSRGGNVALANLLTMLKSVIEFNDTTS
jgi:hypothetical protein